jgi:hypothetical protein
MSMPLTTPDTARLDQLHDNLAIRDLYSRYCRAVDRRSEAELAAIFHPDALIDTASGPERPARYVPMVIARQRSVSAVSHQVTNVLIDFLGSTTAFVQAWATAAERRPGRTREEPDADFIFRVRYGDQVEKRDDRWRVSRRLLVVDHVVRHEAGSGTSGLISGGREDDALEQFRAEVISTHDRIATAC